MNHVTDADFYIPGGGLVGFGDAVIFNVQVYLLLCLEYLMVYWEILLIYIGPSFDLLSCNCFYCFYDNMINHCFWNIAGLTQTMYISRSRQSRKCFLFTMNISQTMVIQSLRNLSNCGVSDPFKLWQKKSIEVLISHILWCVGLWAKFQRGWQDLISVRSRPPSAPFQESHSQAGLASKIADWLDEQYQ